MEIINQQQVQQVMAYAPLLQALQQGFAGQATMPRRNVYPLSPDSDNHDAFAVLPAWNEQVIGVKAFTYFPDNEHHGKSSLYSKVMLFSRQHGEPRALVDGTEITLWRTSAVSALAASYLAAQQAKKLVVFGSGKLAPFMIRAHLSVRDYQQVSLVARNTAKAEAILAQLRQEFAHCQFEHTSASEALIASADTICCATGSHAPLFSGQWLTPGTHIDLIGNHHRDARECDSETIKRSRVYVDSHDNVLNEAGELLIPISEGVFSPEQIQGQLSDLASINRPARQGDNDITLFKSVGTALSDLIAANYVYQQLSDR